VLAHLLLGHSVPPVLTKDVVSQGESGQALAARSRLAQPDLVKDRLEDRPRSTHGY